MKSTKKKLSAIIITVLLLQMFFMVPFPKTDAATITLYPSNYTYVKPAPYWTCDPCDEFPASQQVTVIERDYEFFYIEYTRGGQTKRGYASVNHFNLSTGYVWPSHSIFTPGYNKSGVSQNVYYSPTSSVVAGSIDADEGIASNKPLLVLQQQGNRYFIQYVTNPTENGHVKYKRGWVNTSAIQKTTMSLDSAIGTGKYVLIKNVGTGKYIDVIWDAAAPYKYSIQQYDPTGYVREHWYIKAEGDTTNGYSYKIISGFMKEHCFQIEAHIPVVGNEVELEIEASPTKSQEYYFEKNSDGTYKIKTRCSGGFLVLAAATGNNYLNQQRDTGSVYQKWEIEFFDRFYKPDYESVYFDDDGIEVLTYYVDTSEENGVQNAEATEAMVDQAASLWNEQSNKSGVRLVKSTTGGVIRVVSGNVNRNAYGTTTLPVYNYGDVKYFVNGTINLELDSFPNIPTDTEKIRVICHEFGHALLLEHTRTDDINMNYLYYSVMNPGGQYGNQNRMNNTPHHYDVRTLATKWRGVPNY